MASAFRRTFYGVANDHQRGTFTASVFVELFPAVSVHTIVIVDT